MSVFFSTFTIMENILLYFCCICCTMFFALKMLIKITFSTPRIVTFFTYKIVKRISENFVVFFSILYNHKILPNSFTQKQQKIMLTKNHKKWNLHLYAHNPPFFLRFFKVFLQKIKFTFFIFHFFVDNLKKK